MMKKGLWIIYFQLLAFASLGQSGCPVGFESGPNLIKNGNFENGFEGFQTNYKKTTSHDWFAGSIYITTKPSEVHNNYRLCLDSSHKNLGKMLVVDGSQDRNETIWQQTVVVESGKEYFFSLFFATLMKPNPAQLEITINNQRLSKPFHYEYQHCRGSHYFCFWSSGSNKQAEIKIRASTTDLMGNDFVIDNIRFFSCTKAKPAEPVPSQATYPSTRLVVQLVGPNNEQVPGKVYFKSFTDTLYQNQPTDNAGTARLQLADKPLQIAVRAKGFFFLKDTIPAKAPYKDSVQLIRYSLHPLDSGAVFTLSNLTFDKSSSVLTDDNKKELQNILDLLYENPEIGLEINGHTDNQGDAVKNYNLSVDRVNNVKKFLIEKGISASRINGTGFGGTKPLIGFGSDEDRKINRRVEFVIVKRR